MGRSEKVKRSKLHPPKWMLWLKSVKYWLFQARPVPLFSRRTCEQCKFVFNRDLYVACPHCGNGPNAVWAVVDRNGRIFGMRRSAAEANSFVLELWAEGEYSTVEEHEIQ